MPIITSSQYFTCPFTECKFPMWNLSYIINFPWGINLLSLAFGASNPGCHEKTQLKANNKLFHHLLFSRNLLYNLNKTDTRLARLGIKETQESRRQRIRKTWSSSRSTDTSRIHLSWNNIHRAPAEHEQRTLTPKRTKRFPHSQVGSKKQEGNWWGEEVRWDLQPLGELTGTEGSLILLWEEEAVPARGRQDRVRPLQMVLTTALLPKPERGVHRCTQGLGAGMWGLESRSRQRTGVGCEETSWVGRREGGALQTGMLVEEAWTTREAEQRCWVMPQGQGRHPILCPRVPAFASLGSSEGSQHGPFSSVAQLCPTLCDPMDCRAISWPQLLPPPQQS